MYIYTCMSVCAYLYIHCNPYLHVLLIVHILHSGKLSREKTFTNFAVWELWNVHLYFLLIHESFSLKYFPLFLLSLEKFDHATVLSCVKDCIEDMVTFVTLAKNFSTKYFCNTKVARLGKIFIQQTFSRIYMYTVSNQYNICYRRLFQSATLKHVQGN